jgi:hypothetical protein
VGVMGGGSGDIAGTDGSGLDYQTGLKHGLTLASMVSKISPAQIQESQGTGSPPSAPKAAKKGKAATPAAAPASTIAPQAQQVEDLASPLATQLAFSQTIAPLLQQIAGQQTQQADQYGSIMGQLANNPNIPSQYRAMMQTQIPQMEQAMKNTANEDQIAASVAPGIDALMSQIQQAQSLQKLAQYEQEHAIAYGVGSAANPLAAALTAGVPLTGLPTTGSTGTSATSTALGTPVAPAASGGALTPAQLAQLQALGISIPGVTS